MIIVYVCIGIIAIFLRSCLSSEAACGVATCISDGISIQSLETFVQISAVVHKGEKIEQALPLPCHCCLKR